MRTERHKNTQNTMTQQKFRKYKHEKFVLYVKAILMLICGHLNTVSDEDIKSIVSAK